MTNAHGATKNPIHDLVTQLQETELPTLELRKNQKIQELEKSYAGLLNNSTNAKIFVEIIQNDYMKYLAKPNTDGTLQATLSTDNPDSCQELGNLFVNIETLPTLKKIFSDNDKKPTTQKPLCIPAKNGNPACIIYFYQWAQCVHDTALKARFNNSLKGQAFFDYACQLAYDLSTTQEAPVVEVKTSLDFVSAQEFIDTLSLKIYNDAEWAAVQKRIAATISTAHYRQQVKDAIARYEYMLATVNNKATSLLHLTINAQTFSFSNAQEAQRATFCLANVYNRNLEPTDFENKSVTISNYKTYGPLDLDFTVWVKALGASFSLMQKPVSQIAIQDALASVFEGKTPESTPAQAGPTLENLKQALVVFKAKCVELVKSLNNLMPGKKTDKPLSPLERAQQLERERLAAQAAADAESGW